MAVAVTYGVVMSALPVLDIGPFLADRQSHLAQQFVGDLRDACAGPGFVYLQGHGIAQGVDDALLREARLFFALPQAEREALAIVHSAAFRGYTILGDERTNGEADWRDQLDLGDEQESPGPGAQPAWTRLRGPNQWPDSLPTMQPAVMTWMHEMQSLGLAALRALALGLGQSVDAFDVGFVPEADLHAKVIRYPGSESTSGGQGVGAHQDTGLLTFILQTATGLQVETPDGQFVDAPPIAGTYIMNLGEMLQRATNGFLRATRHKVVSPPAGEDRLSVALFFNPRYDAVFEPVELPADLATKAPGGGVSANGDVISSLFGENNLKTRLRSHPDVAQRHYADVLDS